MSTSSTNCCWIRTIRPVWLSWHSRFRDFGLVLSGGVRNLFDRDPPVCLSCTLNGFDVTTHEIPGQFWYVRAAIDF